MARRPLVAAALLFAAGAGLGAWLPARPAAWAFAAAAALAAWGIALARGADRAGTCAGAATLLLVGIARCQGDLAALAAAGGPEGAVVVDGRVSATPQRRGDAQLLLLDEARMRRSGETSALHGAVQLVVAGGGARFRVGERLTARGRAAAARGDRNLGWFPAPAVPLERRTAARVFVDSPAWVRRAGGDPARGPGAAVMRWREAATGFWQGAPAPAGAILDALTTGERAAVDPAVQEAFLRSGLTHLLAISGMNVAFLAALVYLLLRRALASWERLALRRPVQPLAAAATVPFLWFFYRFSGSQIPVGRATVAAAAAMAAVVVWRRVDAGDAAALAALLFVARDPRCLFSASFQLSFAAVAALVLVAPRLAALPEETEGEGRLRRWRRHARSLLLVSLAAGGATAPLVAFHFQQLSVVGPVANLVAVPLTGFLVLPGAWLAMLAHALWPPAGELLRSAASGLASALVGVADLFAAPAWASLRVPRPPALATLALLVAVASFVSPATAGVRRIRGVAAGAAAAACLLWWTALQRPDLRVVFFDVGQGLSLALFPPGGAPPLLVDAGPRWPEGDAGERVVAPALRRLGVTRLEAFALTHGHPDHAGGAASLLAQLPVGRIWAGTAGPGRGGAEDDRLPLPLRGDRRVELLARGARRAIGGGVRVEVLNPAPGEEGGGRARDANDGSLALLLTWRDAGVLVTGDVGPGVARGVAAAAKAVPAAVALQAPHHGGSPEACRVLAEAFRPAVSVVPVGRNGYGHPRPGAVAALEREGRVLRTDRDGGVFLASDGRGFTARTWREMAAGRTWGERWRWLVAGW